ncbi:hypothetical protein FHW67_000595 [Herbaspirillum sp. Sphag1AN]|nr:hypothetical protein [Herbaspirillum sp. Sphag1AN]MBB3245386.1 hypothetical protein [Herbaspirillum sp. Sphag64]
MGIAGSLSRTFHYRAAQAHGLEPMVMSAVFASDAQQNRHQFHEISRFPMDTHLARNRSGLSPVT